MSFKIMAFFAQMGLGFMSMTNSVLCFDTSFDETIQQTFYVKCD